MGKHCCTIKTDCSIVATNAEKEAHSFGTDMYRGTVDIVQMPEIPVSKSQRHVEALPIHHANSVELIKLVACARLA